MPTHRRAARSAPKDAAGITAAAGGRCVNRTAVTVTMTSSLAVQPRAPDRGLPLDRKNSTSFGRLGGVFDRARRPRRRSTGDSHMNADADRSLLGEKPLRCTLQYRFAAAR
jgi:hypothetical protein